MPFAVKIQVDRAAFARMAAESKKSAAKLKQNLAGALYDTAKHIRTDMSRLIREHVAIKKSDVDKHIELDRATPGKLVAGVILRKTERIPLKYFGARQTKKGVTYKIAKSAEAMALMKSRGPRRGQVTTQQGTRGRIPDAFGPNTPRLGGNVFRRAGKARLPLVKLHGPSAWGVFVRLGLRKQLKKDAQAYLNDRLKRRILYQK